MPMLEQQAKAGVADCGKEKEHIPYPLMGGCSGKLTKAVEADQHDPQTCDQQGEFSPDSGAVPEYEPGDQRSCKWNAAIDQNARMGGRRKGKPRVNQQPVT